MTEERGLAPACIPGVEDVESEELDEASNRRRHCCPDNEGPEDDREVLDPPHQERHGDCEEGVLDELEVADEVVLEEGIVDRRRAKRLEGEPEEQREPGDPEDAPAPTGASQGVRQGRRP